jgi:hypothetical protein
LGVLRRLPPCCLRYALTAFQHLCRFSSRASQYRNLHETHSLLPARATLALAALTASGNALAAGRLAQVAIIDWDSGVTLTPHLYHGEYWVAGRPGATYAIEIRNRIGGRLLAVTSVDGVNVISGETVGWDQTAERQYVPDPPAGIAGELP